MVGADAHLRRADPVLAALIDDYGGPLPLDGLDSLGDEEVVRELTEVKGIGEWTAHMFLMFTLHRPDVLPVGDLGVRNAVRDAYGLQAAPDPAALSAIAEPWRPYRTRASLYLWRSLDNAPVDAT